VKGYPKYRIIEINERYYPQYKNVPFWFYCYYTFYLPSFDGSLTTRECFNTVEEAQKFIEEKHFTYKLEQQKKLKKKYKAEYVPVSEAPLSKALE
jgi:hypothetical protein